MTIRKVTFGGRTLTLNESGVGMSIEAIRKNVAENIDSSYANATMTTDGDTLILTKSGGVKGC